MQFRHFPAFISKDQLMKHTKCVNMDLFVFNQLI